MPTKRLETVLNERNISEIDYLSVENNHNAPQIPEYMQSLGYRRIVRLGVDDIYAK